MQVRVSCSLFHCSVSCLLLLGDTTRGQAKVCVRNGDTKYSIVVVLLLLMIIVYLEQILEAVECGVDVFDGVYPCNE